MIRAVIVVIGMLVMSQGKAAVTVIFPLVQIGHENFTYDRFFQIQFDIPSLNLGEPSSKTDFLDEVTNIKYSEGYGLADLFPDEDSYYYKWLAQLDIHWTGMKAETTINGQLFFGGIYEGACSWCFRWIMFHHGGVQFWEDDYWAQQTVDYAYGSFDPKYITYRDPSGAIPEPWGFGLAIPVLLLLQRRARRL